MILSSVSSFKNFQSNFKVKNSATNKTAQVALNKQPNKDMVSFGSSKSNNIQQIKEFELPEKSGYMSKEDCTRFLKSKNNGYIFNEFSVPNIIDSISIEDGTVNIDTLDFTLEKMSEMRKNYELEPLWSIFACVLAGFKDKTSGEIPQEYKETINGFVKDKAFCQPREFHDPDSGIYVD